MADFLSREDQHSVVDAYWRAKIDSYPADANTLSKIANSLYQMWKYDKDEIDRKFEADSAQ